VGRRGGGAMGRWEGGTLGRWDGGAVGRLDGGAIGRWDGWTVGRSGCGTEIHFKVKYNERDLAEYDVMVSDELS
jgi:hypothetical protein